MISKNIPKNPIFLCEKCHYTTSNKKDFNKHEITRKHTTQSGEDINDIKKISKKSHDDYICDCGNKYKFYSGLWRHQKKCSLKVNINNSTFTNTNNYKKDTLDNIDKDNIILTLLQQNKQLQEQILEFCKKERIHNSHNNNNNNTNSNNKFNLQFFLNETCKDAMNIMDFANSLKLKISDLENVGNIGYIEGISHIIVKNLKELDVSKRPLHCSDIKREILYVKDKDEWCKENEDKDKLREAIKHIAHKNIQMIPEWKKENPDYKLDDGVINDKYLKIVMQSMGGSNKQEDVTYENKIISKIAKNVIIDKDN